VLRRPASARARRTDLQLVHSSASGHGLRMLEKPQKSLTEEMSDRLRDWAAGPHQVELTAGRLHVRRAKGGPPSVHTLQGDEIRALRRLQREQGASSHVFMTERGGPMTPKAFHALVARIGTQAEPEDQHARSKPAFDKCSAHRLTTRFVEIRSRPRRLHIFLCGCSSQHRSVFSLWRRLRRTFSHRLRTSS
jgi:hypothetical protein